MDGRDDRRRSGPEVVPGNGRALGIQVSHGGGAPGLLVSDGKSGRQGGLAGPAFLRDNRDDVHDKQFSRLAV